MSVSAPGSRVVIAGFGSEYRRDDAVGAIVAASAASLRPSTYEVGPLSDPLDLLGKWDGAALVVVIAAVRSGAEPGTIRMIEMDVGGAAGSNDERSIESHETSTHGIGLAGVLRLATALGRAPARLVLVAIEGEEFGFGQELSARVEAAVPEAVRRVVELIEEACSCA